MVMVVMLIVDLNCVPVKHYHKLSTLHDKENDLKSLFNVYVPDLKHKNT